MTCHFGWQVQPILATKNSIYGAFLASSSLSSSCNVTVVHVENKALV